MPHPKARGCGDETEASRSCGEEQDNAKTFVLNNEQTFFTDEIRNSYAGH